MAGRFLLSVGSVALILCGTPELTRAQSAKAGGKLIVVKMVDVSATAFKFEPAAVSVQPGDTLRFQQTTGTPHNAAFTDGPAGSNLGEAQTGPYLLAQGQTYDVVIDSRFIAGNYKLLCVPHQGMGMVGMLTVKSGPGTVTNKAAGPKARTGG